jgi:ribosomal protein S12 methylthiotransferase accessory factor
MQIKFEGKCKVIADYSGFKVLTDLSKELGGEGEALNPFQLFLTSISCCTGLFTRQYLEKHNIPTNDKYLNISFEFDKENSDLKKVFVEIFVGNDFPTEKETALINTLRACKVKKHVREDIEFEYKLLR